MKKTVVITGMGAVTPIGIGVDTYWKNLIGGKCGIRPITRFDTSKLTVKVAAEVDLDPEQFLPKKLVKELPPFMQYAYIAGREALEQGGITADPQAGGLPVDPRRTGIVMGSALDGISVAAQTQEEITQGLHRRVGPRFLPQVLGNVAAAQLSIAYGITGPSFTVNTACSSGGDSVTLAVMLLRAGMADAVLAVGGEAALNPLVASSLCSAQALSRDTDERASRPFDLTRNGFVIGEGGGALLLETEEHARARGAEILGVVLGCANNTDAYHVTAPRPDGAMGGVCMELALADAGLKPEDVDYINAHGTSTTMGDAAEAAAVHAVFGPHAARLAVSSTKGATGHMMGAGGINELIACVQAVRTGILPPTLHYETPDPKCDLDVVPNQAREAKVRAAMSNSFGFGGQNSSVLVGAYLG